MKPAVSFLRLEGAYHELKFEIRAAVDKVLESSNFILGTEVESFEREWASYCGSKYAVGVGNGLDALEFSLRAVGVVPGDEVVVPAHTFIATWLAVTRCGATPVPVDPDPGSFNIGVAGLQGAITEKTRAAIVVHLYGLPAEISSLVSVAKSFGIKLVEDAAQAHGAEYEGRKIGSHSDAVAWSFYPGKNLGAMGDGGAVTTDNGEVSERIRLLRNYGSIEKYAHEIVGFNSRLDELQAAILRVKLKHLDEWNTRRREAAEHYIKQIGSKTNGEESSGQRAEFSSLPGLIALPRFEPNRTAVWHLFVIRVRERERFRALMKNRWAVETGIHYPLTPASQSAYSSANIRTPLAEQLSREVVSLPIGPHSSASEIEQVAEAVVDCLSDE